MQISSKSYILFISCLLISNSLAGSTQDTLCKRDDINQNCKQNFTWAFDENLRICYPVIQEKEPCGFFILQQACIDLCLDPNTNKID